MKKDWEIRDITVGNFVAPPVTEEDREREREPVRRHDPLIMRTLIGGPGNRRTIRGCACRAQDVHDAATWATHIGVPGGERFLKTVLALQDAAQDAVDYPGPETLARLGGALRVPL